MTSDLYSLWPDLALVAWGFHLNRPSMSDYLKVFFRLAPYLTWFDILTSAKVLLFVGIPKFISRKMYGIPKSSSWACRRILASRCDNSSLSFLECISGHSWSFLSKTDNLLKRIFLRSSSAQSPPLSRWTGMPKYSYIVLSFYFFSVLFNFRKLRLLRS